MTDREYKELKKKLLQGDRQAYRDLFLSADIEAADKADKDPEIMAYLETREMADYLTDKELESLANVIKIATEYRSKILDALDNAKPILQGIGKAASAYIDLHGEILTTLEYAEEILSLPEYALLTPYQFFAEKHIDENGNEYTIYQKVKEEIRARKEADKTTDLQPGKRKQLPTPGSANLRKLLQAKDAPNMISIKGASDMLWNLTKKELEVANNQFALLPPGYQDHGALYDTGNDTYLLFAFNFDEVGENFSGLSLKHKAIHDAVENLRRKGYRQVTLTDIFNNSALSKGNPPTNADLKFIYEALKEMRSIKVLYDSTHDYESYQKKLGDFVIREGRLLDIQGFDYLISDKQLKSIVVLLGDMPAPLLDNAIRKGQYFQVQKKVLQTPLTKNDNMLRLQAYMIETIEFMKDPKKNRSNEILIESMLKALGKPGNREYKARLISKPGYLIELLDYWKKIKYIKGYDIQWDRVIIKINKTTPQITEKP